VTLEPLAAPRGAGWIADRDPRLRILSALLFALVTVSLARPPVAFAALGLAAVMAAGSGWGVRDLLRRLAAMEILMVVLLLTLPFTVPGEGALRVGPLTASREGLLAALMIALKANAVVLALLALVGSLEPVVFGHALGRLGVPDKLVHLLLLTVRQIHLLHREFLRLRQAMRARAFVPRSDGHTWRSYGYLVGMLLVRSLERSRRVLAAMRCRGFHGRLYLLDSTHWRPADTVLAVGLALLLVCLPLLDHLS
jgi:cobalt/nickel transport system permease protein